MSMDYFLRFIIYFINLCIYAERFISHQPSVYYTLTIAICKLLCSILLLFNM